ncbi:Phosphatidylinositol 4-phosphate 5-kinase 10 [Camellia lanceoleosa]|uniref:Phosphatidylinositol 4-phosphate 5-kinase 10 n=1 Tax=Camellia lanceoleosa TaxID=1840588 RepID=A0ACC0I7I3_9ERIC|nr:Phosphatidylinositol 4-phosphate 5-kinase 10 [Camellia lanceoleosa]
MSRLWLSIRHFVGQYTVLPKKELSPNDFKSTQSTWIQYSKQNPKSLPPGTVTDFQWKDYCPAVFRHLQELGNIDYADYMLSVCGHETLMEISSPGKSGSLLFRSKDDRFVIKTLRQSEVKVLCEMLPNYLRHVEQYGASLLIKLYGLHAVRPIGGLKVYFVVMENVLQSDLYIHRCYDLKGSSQGRTISKAEDHERATFKDLDLDFLFYLEPLTRHKLLAQIKNDCKFLEDQGIMDYSLLLGMHIKAQSQGDFRASGEVSAIFPSCYDSILNDGIACSNNTTHSYTVQGCKDSEWAPADICLIRNRPDAKFGVKMPARAVRGRRKGKDDMALNQEVEGMLQCFVVLRNNRYSSRVQHEEAHRACLQSNTV